MFGPFAGHPRWSSKKQIVPCTGNLAFGVCESLREAVHGEDFCVEPVNIDGCGLDRLRPVLFSPGQTAHLLDQRVRRSITCLGGTGCSLCDKCFEGARKA